MTHIKPSAARVLVLLRRAGPVGLTPIEALDNGGGLRLSGRVLELRQAGFDIETCWETKHGATYARYVLHENVQLALGVA